MSNPIPFLRQIAFVEGLSFLVLLFLAMPLKYLAGMPLPVRIVGSLHGLLFVVFCFALLRTWIVAKWSIGRCTLVFIASLLPFGPMFVDRRMLAWEKDFQGERP